MYFLKLFDSCFTFFHLTNKTDRKLVQNSIEKKIFSAEKQNKNNCQFIKKSYCNTGAKYEIETINSEVNNIEISLLVNEEEIQINESDVEGLNFKQRLCSFYDNKTNDFDNNYLINTSDAFVLLGWSKNIYFEATYNFIVSKTDYTNNIENIMLIFNDIWDFVSQDKYDLAWILSCILYNTNFLKKYTLTQNIFFGRGLLQLSSNCTNENLEVKNLTGFSSDLIFKETEVFWNFLSKNNLKIWETLEEAYINEKWETIDEQNSLQLFILYKDFRFNIYKDLLKLFKSYFFTFNVMLYLIFLKIYVEIFL